MQDKISLAGDLGSGKSTVSKILIDRLGAEYYSTGSIVRAIAERMGMTVVELNRYMETHPEIDTEIDDGLRALAQDPRLLIIDSRMAWHFTPGTFKVYMSTDIEVSATRIMLANRKGEHALSLEQTVLDTRARRESEKKRYSEYYGVDITDLSNYDLIVDTTYATPEQIAEAIIDCFRIWQSDKSKKFCLISPERILYPDDEPNSERLAEYSSLLECGEKLPRAEVVECNGEFYLTGDVESVIALSLESACFVSLKLTDGEVEAANYVKMKNSL